jgi:CheY-like chemotaxis protein
MRTVLFADDMEEVRTLSCGALQQHGYAVLAAGDGLRLFLWQASIETRSIRRSQMS